jgi:hypothetical protein
MPYIIPIQRRSVAKSTLFYTYKTVDESPDFRLQCNKSSSSTRARFRIITRGRLFYHELARGDTIASIHDQWIYLKTDLLLLMPPMGSKRHRLAWIVSQVTKLAVEAGENKEDQVDADADSLMHLPATPSRNGIDIGIGRRKPKKKPSGGVGKDALHLNYAKILLTQYPAGNPVPVRIHGTKIWLAAAVSMNLSIFLLRDVSFATFAFAAVAINVLLFLMVMLGSPFTLYVGGVLSGDEEQFVARKHHTMAMVAHQRTVLCDLLHAYEKTQKNTRKQRLIIQRIYNERSNAHDNSTDSSMPLRGGEDNSNKPSAEDKNNITHKTT